MADGREREREEEETELARVIRQTEEENTRSPHTSPPITPSHPHGGHTLQVERSRQWRKETDSKLSLLAQRMMSVMVTSEGWRVRRAVVLWAHCLLGNCRRSLVATVPKLLETLLSLSRDGYSEVSTAALLSLVRETHTPTLTISHTPLSHTLNSVTHSHTLSLIHMLTHLHVYTY